MKSASRIILFFCCLLITACGSISKDIYIPASLQDQDRKTLFVVQGCGKAAKVDGKGPSKGVFTNFLLQPNTKHTLSFPTPNSGSMQQPMTEIEVSGKPGEVKSCSNLVLGR